LTLGIVTELVLLGATLHAGLIGAAAVGPIWRALPAEADSFALRAFFALALGLAIEIALLFVLGVLGQFDLRGVFAVGLLSTALAGLRLLRTEPLKAWRWPSPLEMGMAAAFYVWAAAAAVRTPGHFDDTMYHLPLARFYAEMHGLPLDPFVRFPLFPQNMELTFALAFILRPGDVLLAQGLAALPAFIVALGLVGAARWLRGSWIVAIGAAVLFLSIPITEKMLGFAYIDAGLALFCFAAMLGAALLGAGAPLGAYAVVGVLAGTACGCKIYGLVAAAIVLALLLVGRARPSALAAFVAAGAVFGLGWYARSYAISGDPISPAGGPWFGFFLWDARDLAGQREEQATHGVGHALWKFPQAIIKAGANWLLPGLLAPFAARRERRALLMLWATFVAYALFWFFVSQVDRYLAPVHALGALLAIIVVYDAVVALAGRFAPQALAFAQRPAVAASAAALLLLGTLEHPIERASHVMRKWDGAIAQRPGYALLQVANAARPKWGDRLVQFRMESSRYFFDGEMIGDWFGPARYRQMWDESTGKLIPAAEMRKLMERFDARLLALNLKGAAFDSADYDRQFETLARRGDELLLGLRGKS
jgi:hypothetical protein